MAARPTDRKGAPGARYVTNAPDGTVRLVADGSGRVPIEDAVQARAADSFGLGIWRAPPKPKPAPEPEPED